jgi:hypothetical protein
MNDQPVFTKAVKRQGFLRVAFTGPSGSGKTLSSLLVADGIVKAMTIPGGSTPRIAVVDTENASANDYVDTDGLEFDVLIIDPPYTVPRFLAAVDAAEKAGYGVIVLDSISHVWSGEGGLLQKKEALASRGGNSYTNWGAITKEHEAFRAMLLTCKAHLIATMRSKQEYVLQADDRGKAVPKKVGMAPIQRDGMEYEFTAVFDLGMDHQVLISKDRTGLFDGRIFVPTRALGLELWNWRVGNVAAAAIMPPAAAARPAVEAGLDESAERFAKAEGGQAAPAEVPVAAPERTHVDNPTPPAPANGNGGTAGIKLASPAQYHLINVLCDQLGIGDGEAEARRMGFAIPLTSKSASGMINELKRQQRAKPQAAAR